MKHFLLAITAIFFGITLTFGQDIQEISTDSLQAVEHTPNIKSNSENVNDIFNDWQLLSHDTYENYPEAKIGDVDFIKGKEFLNLGENGAYVSILNNSFVLLFMFFLRFLHPKLTPVFVGEDQTVEKIGNT